MAQWTSGPWRYDPQANAYGGEAVVRASDNYRVASACGPMKSQTMRGPENVVANARLIALAPEMAEALRSVTIWIEEYVLPAANNPQAVRRFITHNRALLARLEK